MTEVQSKYCSQGLVLATAEERARGYGDHELTDYLKTTGSPFEFCFERQLRARDHLKQCNEALASFEKEQNIPSRCKHGEKRQAMKPEVASKWWELTAAVREAETDVAYAAHKLAQCGEPDAL